MSAQSPFEEPATQTGSADAAVPMEEDGGVLYEEQVQPEYGVLGMTLRELLIVAVWLIAFVVSFFPVLPGTGSLWTQGVEWILPIGVPTVAAFLLVLRRFSPDGIRRVGSLGIDQFASVAFSVAAVYWVQFAWQTISLFISSGRLLASWVPWVELAASLGLVVLTVVAPLIPGLRDDFRGRLETLAHRNANPVRPVIARPRAPRPVAPPQPADHAGPYATGEQNPYATGEEPAVEFSAQVPLTAHVSGGELGAGSPTEESGYVPGYARRSGRTAPEPDDVDLVADTVTAPRESVEQDAPVEPHASAGQDEVIDAVPVAVPAAEPAPAAQPFWALAPTERDVVDESGAPIFRIGPTAWALVIEDRGGAYVIRHDDGRIGFLHDIADMTRG